MARGESLLSSRGLRKWWSVVRGDSEESRLLRNFLFFALFFCITHASVDAILAFSTAELGYELGSRGSFVLYLLYTLSALLLAKPMVARLGAKNGVLFGLCGLICYVVSFFIALNTEHEGAQEGIWILGAAMGGIGAGVLWTSQGAYYSLNAKAYALAAVNNKDTSDTTGLIGAQDVSSSQSDSALSSGMARDNSGDGDDDDSVRADGGASAGAAGSGNDNINSSSSSSDGSSSEAEEEVATSAAIFLFASIFAAGYLLLETLFKIFATGVYLADTTSETWKNLVFGVYMVTGLIAVIFFGINIRAFVSSEDASSSTSSIHQPMGERMKSDILGVLMAMATDRKLQLILPYQICFGFSSSMVNAFITSQIVSRYIGDGYVGFLSALTTLTAVGCSYPFTTITNNFTHGKYWIMIGGGVSFLLVGLAVFMGKHNLGTWGTLVFYFFIYGFGRGAWENTNKGIVAEYFGEKEEEKAPIKGSGGNGGNRGSSSNSGGKSNTTGIDGVPDDNNNSNNNSIMSASFTITTTQSAFASVYFTSGLSAAIGFASYSSMTPDQIAVLNTFMPIFAMICFHKSYRMHSAQMHVLSLESNSDSSGNGSSNKA
jgi:hypothetical protein